MFGKRGCGGLRALCQQNINKDLNELKISYKDLDERARGCGLGEIICWVYVSWRLKPDKKNRAVTVMACWFRDEPQIYCACIVLLIRSISELKNRSFYTQKKNV